jgi:hypothetical protein
MNLDEKWMETLELSHFSAIEHFHTVSYQKKLRSLSHLGWNKCPGQKTRDLAKLVYCTDPVAPI